jgi:hypothetical protein
VFAAAGVEDDAGELPPQAVTAAAAAAIPTRRILDGLI